MVGYWAPNVAGMVAEMKKELGDDPQAAAVIPMMTAMMGMVTIEFRKGEVTIHKPDGNETSTYKLTNTDEAAKTLTMDVTSEEGTEEGTAQLNGDQLILKKGDDTLILDRIDEAQFEARKKAAEAAAAGGGLVPGGGSPVPPVPPIPVAPPVPGAPQ